MRHDEGELWVSAALSNVEPPHGSDNRQKILPLTARRCHNTVMLQAEIEPATHRPLGRYGQLETDAFCSGCGYNLHGQDVSMDERLAFLVCRCPECGRFHPAGANTSANSIWISRFCTILLVVWVGVVLACAALLMLALGGMQMSYVG